MSLQNQPVLSADVDRSEFGRRSRGDNLTIGSIGVLSLRLWVVLFATGLAPSWEVGPAALAAESHSDAVNDSEWIEKGREALSSRLEPVPWYDSSADRLRPINVPAKPENKKSEEEGANERFRDLPSWLSTAFKAFAYGLLAIALLAIAWEMWRAYQLDINVFTALGDRFVAIWRSITALFRGEIARPQPVVADQVDALPVALDTPVEEFLAAARRLYEQGDYGRAIVYLYSHELVELDKRQRIRLDRGKTNRQYLRELAAQPALRSLLGDTIDPFERVIFGGEPLNRADFEACWRQLPKLNQLLAEAPA
jgi:hypothetical protein